jgi:hypothetical protein
MFYRDSQPQAAGARGTTNDLTSSLEAAAKPLSVFAAGVLATLRSPLQPSTDAERHAYFIVSPLE